MSTSWKIAIDWIRNGEFSGEDDDITQRADRLVIDLSHTPITS